MRMGLLFLAGCGMICLAIQVGIADELLPHPASTKAPAQVDPFADSTKATLTTENYYTELFGAKKVQKKVQQAAGKQPSPFSQAFQSKDAAWTQQPNQGQNKQLKKETQGRIVQTAGEIFNPFGNSAPAPGDDNENLDIVLPKTNLGTAQKKPFVPTPIQKIPAGQVQVNVTPTPSLFEVAPIKPQSNLQQPTNPFAPQTAATQTAATQPKASRGGVTNLFARPAAPQTTSQAQSPFQQQPVTRFASQSKKIVPSIATPATSLPTTATPKIEKTGPQTPSLTIRWESKSEVNVGQNSLCFLIVENEGTVAAEKVVVEAGFPNTVRLVDASPAPDAAEGNLTWTLGNLPAGQTRKIAITMVPSKSGSIATQARVRFTGTSNSLFTVREPKLKIVIEGSNEFLMGDPATQRVTISNPGTGVAKNVRLQAIIPKGLEHPKGEKLMMEMGSLNPGEKRTIRLALAAVAGGQYNLQVTALADGGLDDRTTAKIKVVAPSLEVAAKGPKLRYKGRIATYRLAVRNTGGITTNNVRLLHKIPVGMEFVSSDRGATFDKATRILTWFVGRLDSGKTAETKVNLRASTIGNFQHFIRATSEEGSHSDVKISTQVDGISSLVLKVSDVEDPIEVGKEAAYDITVSNEGSKNATNVVLQCQLFNGMELISAKGATDHVSELNRVTFRPLKTLAPGKTKTYRVLVRGRVAGSVKFRVQVKSDSSPNGLTSEEQTKFYSEN